jgi:hypothetical protein
VRKEKYIHAQLIIIIIITTTIICHNVTYFGKTQPLLFNQSNTQGQVSANPGKHGV